MDTNEIIEAINALEPITRTQLIISVTRRNAVYQTEH